MRILTHHNIRNDRFGRNLSTTIDILFRSTTLLGVESSCLVIIMHGSIIRANDFTVTTPSFGGIELKSFKQMRELCFSNSLRIFCSYLAVAY